MVLMADQCTVSVKVERMDVCETRSSGGAKPRRLASPPLVPDRSLHLYEGGTSWQIFFTDLGREHLPAPFRGPSASLSSSQRGASMVGRYNKTRRSSVSGERAARLVDVQLLGHDRE